MNVPPDVAYVRRRQSKRESQEDNVSELTRFLGDTPLRIFLKLLVVSFLVGIVMSYFGWSPYDVFYQMRDFVLQIWNMGFKAIDRFMGYFLLGAAVVVPAFVVLRLFSYRR